MRAIATLGKETVTERGRLVIDFWKPYYSKKQKDSVFDPKDFKDVGEFYQIRIGDTDLASLLYQLEKNTDEISPNTYDLGEIIIILHRITKEFK